MNNSTPQTSGPTTTANSTSEGRMKVDASGLSKQEKKIALKHVLKNVLKDAKVVKMKVKMR
jgi:hypothetical protein